ncbi:hypothetical protein CPB86DRAFT_782715 [Serendipita vermifera]|nr:hypothetical protein CPB86DRAFT_782715 [Serendipita vermifera]
MRISLPILRLALARCVNCPPTLYGGIRESEPDNLSVKTKRPSHFASIPSEADSEQSFYLPVGARISGGRPYTLLSAHTS